MLKKNLQLSQEKNKERNLTPLNHVRKKKLEEKKNFYNMLERKKIKEKKSFFQICNNMFLY